MPSGSLWMNCTARPPTSRPTPTSTLCSWAAWVDRETSTRTMCWNCWGRSLTQPVSQLMSQWLMRLTRLSNRTAYYTTDSSESIKRKKIWQLCRKAANRYGCDKVAAVHSSDKQPGTKGKCQWSISSAVHSSAAGVETRNSSTLGDMQSQCVSFHATALTCTLCKCHVCYSSSCYFFIFLRNTLILTSVCSALKSSNISPDG